MIARKRKCSFACGEMNNNCQQDMKKICKGLGEQLYIEQCHLNLNKNNTTDDVEMSSLIQEPVQDEPISQTYFSKSTSCPQCQAGLSGHYNHITQHSGNT